MRRLSSLTLVSLLATTGPLRAQEPPTSDAPDGEAPPSEPARAPTQTPAPAQQAGGTDPSGEGTKSPPAPPLPPYRHVPLNETDAGPLRLRFEVREPDRAGRVVVRWKSAPASDRVGEAIAYRAQEGYVADLPAQATEPPGFSYWVVARDAEGEEEPVFASAAEPHHVRVFHDDETRGELDRLRERGLHRSSLLLSGDWVDFGDRQLAAGAAVEHDRYYRLEAGYRYSFLRRIEDIQLSVVHVRGQAARLAPALPTPGLPPTTVVEAVDPGIDYGRAAVTILAADGVRLRGAALLGASQEGFEAGGGAALVFGNPLRTHVELSSEALSTLGFTSSLRMGFLAVERVPMGATVEVSNFPLGEDTGVRLLYDVGYELLPGTVAIVRGGYQSRTSVTGGAALGAAVRYGF